MNFGENYDGKNESCGKKMLQYTFFKTFYDASFIETVRDNMTLIKHCG